VNADPFREPWRFGFFQAVRILEQIARIERKAGGAEPDGATGVTSDPRAEAVRFRATTSLAFPASEIVGSKPSEGGAPAELTVGFMSLAGAMGALPAPYAALLQGRAAQSAFADFLDMFHSRLIGCFYAAWAKYRLPVSFERRESGGDDISSLLKALVGLGVPGVERRLKIEDDLAIHYGGEFARVARSAGGLERLLASEFSLPLRIEQFIGNWIEIAHGEQTRLTADPLAINPFSRLSRGAVVGARIWEVEGAFQVVIGPLDQEEFRRLLPSESDFGRIRDFVRLFAPNHLRFTIRLILQPDAVPQARVAADDNAVQLGWTSWLSGNRLYGEDAAIQLLG
jgi:type VI secretion system protein ImpH